MDTRITKIWLCFQIPTKYKDDSHRCVERGDSSLELSKNKNLIFFAYFYSTSQKYISIILLSNSKYSRSYNRFSVQPFNALRWKWSRLERAEILCSQNPKYIKTKKIYTIHMLHYIYNILVFIYVYVYNTLVQDIH